MTSLLLCRFFRKELEQPGPAAVDPLTHLLAASRSHALEAAVFELDARAPASLSGESHLDFGAERGPRVGFPVGTDFPRDDQPFARLPDTHMSDDHVGAILVTRVPASALEGLDDRLAHRCRADAMRLRPPAIDPRGKHGEGALRICVHQDALAYRCDFNGAVQGFFLPRAGLVVATSLLVATSFLKDRRASSQNWSSQRRSSPRPSGSMY